MTDEICYLSATELLEKYASGAISPVDVVMSTLSRIDALNPILNAFCIIDHEFARSAARESEARWRRKEPIGPLDGVPATIKDILLTKGWPTLKGSRTIDPNQPWQEDAPVTARLREAGAILLGKTTTSEFGWKAVGDSPLTGITRNPWNLGMTPGASSAGAAAQVAAGLGPLAVGTDGGGSIRIPASFCGIVGLKPSFGRVPAWPASVFGTVAHVGPMSRTVDDAALMLTVISQPDSRDWYALPYQAVDYHCDMDVDLKGLKIAFSRTLGYAKIDVEIAGAIQSSMDVFKSCGAIVDEVDPGFPNPQKTHLTLWRSAALHLVEGISRENRSLMDPGLLEAVEKAREYTVLDYLDATSARAQLGHQMKQFHRQYDLLITPSTAVPAFEVGQIVPDAYAGADWSEWAPFSYPFNLTQQPAISIPCGFTSSGLPIGLQIVGRMHDDRLVLRAARKFESISQIVRKPVL